MNVQEYIEGSVELFEASEKELGELLTEVAECESSIDEDNDKIAKVVSDMSAVREATEEAVEADSWEDDKMTKRKKELSNQDKRNKEVDRRMGESPAHQDLEKELESLKNEKKQLTNLLGKKRDRIAMVRERTANRRAILKALS